MNREQQKLCIDIYNQYKKTGTHIIKYNFKKYMDKSGLKISEIAKLTGIPVQSLYQLRKPYADYCPDYITALIICDCLAISVINVINYGKLVE